MFDDEVTQLGKFPNAAVNSNDKRRLRASLYHPRLKLSASARPRVVDVMIAVLLKDSDG